MPNNGWIKVHRRLTEKGYYTDSHYVHLWVHLIFKANHKPKEFLFNGKIEMCKRGQFITGRNILARETGIDRNKIDRVLKVFENEHQIEQLMTNRFRLITVLNYDAFQRFEQQSEPQVSRKRAASEPQVSTNNNEKNIRKKEKKGAGREEVKIEKTHPYFSNEEFKKSWLGFLENRKKLKAVPTERAKELVIKDLEKYSGGDIGGACKLLDQSTMNGWKVVFPLREEQRRVTTPAGPGLPPLATEILRKRNES